MIHLILKKTIKNFHEKYDMGAAITIVAITTLPVKTCSNESCSYVISKGEVMLVIKAQEAMLLK